MKIDLIEYIAHRSPPSFFARVVELMEAAYFSAFQHAETFEEPERSRVLGQLRHYRQNEALRSAAEESGLTAAAPHTAPKGERYSLVAARDIRFSRIGVPFNNDMPRPSKHRRAIAALNARLEPVNNTLFDAPISVPSDGLGCLLVTVNPHRREPQSVPAAVMVGVPYSSLRGWHLFESLSSVMASYHPETEMDVPDLAWARLKKQLQDSEG